MDRVSRVLGHLSPNLTAAGERPEVLIVSACRTPLGGFNGVLSSVSATALGSAAIAAALERANVPASAVGEVLMGNVLSADLGQAPARQAALGAKLPTSVPCTTINKVCSSGLKAVMMGCAQIQLGQQTCVVAGGMENMSSVPYYVPKARFGMKFGDGKLVDGLSKDGLTDAYAKTAMGNCGELCSKELKISREAQDDYAEQSFRRAQEADKAGLLKAEIVPVTAGKKVVVQDEQIHKVNFKKLRSLKPVFQKDGTVTAGNASAISDGAAAVVLMEANAYREMQKGQPSSQPVARVLAYADAAQAPEWFTTAPALAIEKALKLAGKTKDEVDAWEINEAFAVVSIANQQLLGLDPAKLNQWGGAVSLGHPLGASGCRILVTLLHVLKATGGKVGVAAICNGGGGASALVVELL